MTIKEVNVGLDYIQDDVAVALFGVIEKKVEWDDVTVASNLLTKGRNKLQELINATVSIDLSAADLHNLDVNIEAFRVGDNVRVISIPHGLDRHFLLSKLHLELDKPSACTMTLGAVFKSFTQKQLESQKRINAAIKATEGVVVNINELSNSVNQTNARIDNFIVEVPSEYVKTTEYNQFKIGLAQTLSGFLTETSANAKYAAKEDLGDYAKKTYVENLLKDYSKTTDVNTMLKDYSKTTDISKMLEDYVETSEYEKLVKRVENLENKENNDGGNE